jgi:type IV pilus assembly protein PilQ
MRKKSIIMFLLIGFVMFIGSLFCMGAVPLGAADPPAPQAFNVGYLENIALESLAGKERITITVSRLSSSTVENQSGNALLVKLDNMVVPQDFRIPRGEGVLRNVLRVLPAQKVLDGKQWAYLTIDLKERVPHSVRQEGQNILIDFNVAALKEPANRPGAPKDAALQDKVAGSEQAPESKNYDGRQVSIDFQDAPIKSVLLGLAKLADINIVSGDDVKGNVTIQMKNVPWEQALNTILTITGLSKRQDGNVITVMEQAKLKKSEDDRAAAEKEKARKEEADQLREPLITRVVPIAYNKPEEVKKNIEDLLKSTDAKDSKDPKQPTDSKAASSSSSVTIDNHTNSLIIKATRRDMDSLLRFIEKIDKPTAQILIKANIVETTKNTARDLGIQWGGMWGQKIGSQGLYVTPGGTGGSATAPGNAFSGGYTPAYGSTGISGQGYGVNFPAAVTGAASLGLMFGSIGENILELQLSALQKDGKLNILSSPSITTLDNQVAFTENGEKIPYVSIDKNGSPNVQFQDAVLRLEITPHIVDDKSLKMLILVKKDEVDTARSVSGNPFIVKKQTQTNLIVQDGETIVISGLTKQKTTENISGVPWLKDIPVLGWLFKGEGKGETMEEVLIFITPTIMKPQEVAGIQTGS